PPTPAGAAPSARVGSVQSRLRSPRTGVMIAAGFGFAAFGMPNGVDEMPPAPAMAAEATATVTAISAPPIGGRPPRRSVTRLRTLMTPLPSSRPSAERVQDLTSGPFAALHASV